MKRTEWYVIPRVSYTGQGIEGINLHFFNGRKRNATEVRKQYEEFRESNGVIAGIRKTEEYLLSTFGNADYIESVFASHFTIKTQRNMEESPKRWYGASLFDAELKKVVTNAIFKLVNLDDGTEAIKILKARYVNYISEIHEHVLSDTPDILKG